ncbi:MAG: sulfurtransferase [Cenarchaeum sp. SB0665_bin_23]|nr:sulfurtransferase [Cenarchaeum sp. SB0667_bin_13]MXY61078.1 sulfurtransferase [Cenarchaeum sp. SB0665_bin_23]MXZ93209.1 sulfurtransferase [Cenarchaeum sp. SB0666_bin_15]MYC80134.1 sulfurtransferase [Cenarchaeum sp. SB0661_bin_35]MYD58107.1 sulfurtransferase [Cenarchaeum sp. SB0678_bin_8]MYG33575.1 sulfurtransferase [Cenarchaeum sp. SB0677_bin_16]MYI51489.1 sulfurtransferase [Cenarchaeum sp. SB0673_bin_9]
MTQQQFHKSGVAIPYEQASTDDAILIVDVRSKREYEDGHIPDAINIPLAKILQAGDGLGKTFGSFGVGPKTHCVFYDDAYGAVASRAAMALEAIGGRASLLDVTYTVWRSEYLPATGAADKVESTTFEVEPTQPAGRMLTDIDDVEDVVDTGSSILLDARERLNYLSGHIPGAINMPYTMFKDAENNKILRAPDDLSRIFKNRGLDPNKPIRIITYCGSAGTLSGLVYYALRQAGFTQISMYANSFREWNTQERRAVEVQEDANYWDLSAE